MGDPKYVLHRFLEALESTDPGESAFNPWRDRCELRDLAPDAPVQRRTRLRAHLSTTPELILVGEAPGWQGARYGGVPFGSEALMYAGDMPRIPALTRFTTAGKPMTEPIASMVWGELHRWNIADRVVCFNAYPFHPHTDGKPLSNRTPTNAEIRAHVELLELFLALFPGVPIVAIGAASAKTFAALNHPVHATVRHPSYGGKADFARGLGELVVRLDIATPEPTLGVFA